MKGIYFFVVFVLGSTLTNALEPSELDNIIDGLRPQRITPLAVHNRPLEKFHEYYLSGKGLACGFRIFNLERQEGINLIRKKLTSKTVQQFVSNSIFLEEDQYFKEIYQQEKTEASDLNEFSQNDVHRQTYLQFYAEEERSLPLGVNRLEDGSPVPNYAKTFGLLDALAYIQQKNLYVYMRSIDDSSSPLILVHSFVLHGNSNYVRSLHHNNHFNLLVDSTNERACEAASVQEQRFLQQQRQDLASSLDVEDGIDASSSLMNYFPASAISPPFSSLSDRHQSIPARAGPSVPATTRAPSSVSTLSESTRREEQGTEQVRSISPRDPHLTLETVSQFINRDKKFPRFPTLTRQKSIGAAFAFLQNALTAIPSLLSVEDKILYQFGMVRLFLEFQYHPTPLTSEQHGRNLTSHMNSIIKEYFKSKEAKLKRFANYARIYLGKLFVVSRRFDDAYAVFQQVGSKYTKTYLVDMAEMIIDHGYRPADLGDRDPNAFAISLLTQANHHTGTGDSRSHTGRRVRRDNSESIGRPLFLSNESVRVRQNNLYEATRSRPSKHTRQIEHTESTSPPLLQLLCKARGEESPPR